MNLMYMTYTGSILFKKKLKTFIESLVEIHVGEILKDRKGIIFRMAYFGHTYIEYFLENNDEVRPLSKDAVVSMVSEWRWRWHADQHMPAFMC